MWQIAGAIALISALLGGFTGYHFEHNRYQEYKTSIEIAGKIAQKAADLTKAQQEKNKKKADEENKRLSSNVAAANKRLLDSIASRSFLPPATPGAGDPEVVCFDRAKFDQATRKLATGVSGLTGKGDQAITDINTARKWAQD